MLEGNNLILKIQRGDVIFKKGEKVTHLALLIKGSAVVSDSYLQLPLQSGALIGILDINSPTYLFDYVASEAVMICLMEYSQISDIKAFSSAIKEYRDHIVFSACNQLTEHIAIYRSLSSISRELCDSLKTYYADYLTLCNEYLKKPVVNKSIYELAICVNDEDISDIELNYIQSVADTPADFRKPFLESSDDLAYYNCMVCSNLAVKLSELNTYFYNFYVSTFDLLYNKGINNIFAMYSQLSLEIATANGDMTRLNQDVEEIVNLINKCKNMLEEVLGLEFQHDFSRIKDIRRAISDKIDSNKTTTTSSEDNILLTYSDAQITKAVNDTVNSLKIILDYSGIDASVAEALEKALTVYRSLKDPLSTDDSVRKIRSTISDIFYQVYERVYFKAKACGDTSKIIDMFLSFGYMDERMLSKKQLVSLYYIDTKPYKSNLSVYTLRQWLDAIYDGKREPSKNEFDLDFFENFKEMKKNKAFSPEEERLYLSNQTEKVKFELANMVRINNRLCSGHLLTFIPVLESSDFIGEVEKMYLTGAKIEEALNNVLSVDFSAFYREYLYEDKSRKIPKITLLKEVLPDVILMPGVGQKSSMWQEISGKHRNSPARFIIPAFTIERVYDMIIKMVGAFRWELCRTVQGTYWNDIREKSLTSEYCDYLQFYKKNHDLSEDAKDKIKSQYIKARNNTREMFVLDYEQWIKSESLGMSRLNKVARVILFSYCPFSMEYRKKVAEMPMFLDGISKYDRVRIKKIREINNRITAIKNAGGEITQEISDTLSYYTNH